MSTHTVPPGFQRVPLFAAGALVVLAVVAVSAVSLTGVGRVQVPDAPAVTMREFLFEDRSDGGIDIMDARSGKLVDSVAPASNGFLRGTMRGLARERMRTGVGREQPFQMIGRADGRLTLVDPATNRRVDLDSFGPTNAAVFAKLMATPTKP